MLSSYGHVTMKSVYIVQIEISACYCLMHVALWIFSSTFLNIQPLLITFNQIPPLAPPYFNIFWTLLLALCWDTNYFFEASIWTPFLGTFSRYFSFTLFCEIFLALFLYFLGHFSKLAIKISTFDQH